MTNPHISTATEYLEAVATAEDGREDRRLTMQAAQIEATLALAAEQARTADALEAANLIAYLNTAGLYRLASPTPENVLKHIQADVEIRLGLA